MEKVDVSLTRVPATDGGIDRFNLDIKTTPIGAMPAQETPTTPKPQHFPMHVMIDNGAGFFVLKNAMMNQFYVSKGGEMQTDASGFLKMHSLPAQGWQLPLPNMMAPPPPIFDQASLQNIMLLNGQNLFMQTNAVQLSSELKSSETEGAVSIAIGPAQADLATVLGNPATWPVEFTLQLNQDTAVTVQIQNTDTIYELSTAITNANPQINAWLNGDKIVVMPMNDNDSITLADSGSVTAVTSLFGASPKTDHGIDFRETLHIIDTNGASHPVELQYKKMSGDQWNVNAYKMNLPNLGGDYIGWATLNFDPASGNLMSAHGDLATGANISWPDGINQMIPFDFNGMKQAADYLMKDVVQDGQPFAYQTGMELTDNGIVRGTFSNGEQHDLAKLALAQYSDENFVQNMPQSLWTDGADTVNPMTVVQFDSSGTTYSKS